MDALISECHEANSHPPYSLLSPIGEHKSRNVVPSRGKRAKKRKRKLDGTLKEQSAAPSDKESTETESMARPEMHGHLTVGFNTTTRYIEVLARNPRPSMMQEPGPVMAIEETSAGPSFDPAEVRPLTAVFVTRSSQLLALHSCLPLLAKVASLSAPSSPSIRIVTLPEGAEDRLKAALGIPRVGMVGLIDGAPSALSLIEVIRENVPELEVPWLQEAVKGAYLAVKIKAIETSVPLDF